MKKSVYVTLVVFILLISNIFAASDFGPMCYSYCQNPEGCTCDGSCRNYFAACGASCQGASDPEIVAGEICNPPAIPILYLKMDESNWAYNNGDIIDSSDNDNHFSSKNAVIAPGLFGNAGEFADGHYIYSYEAKNQINGLTEFTISTWVKSDDVNSDNGIFKTDWNQDRDRVLNLRYDEDGLEFGNSENGIKASIKTSVGYQILESSSNLQSMDWQHLVLRWKSGQDLELFVDGSKDVGADISGNIGGHLTGNSKVVIGRGVKDQGANKGWDGLIDDFRIYDKRLSNSEIQDIYAEAGSSDSNGQTTASGAPNTNTPQTGDPNAPLGGTHYDSKNIGGITLTDTHLIDENQDVLQDKDIWEPEVVDNSKGLVTKDAMVNNDEVVDNYILGNTQKIQTQDGFVVNDVKYAEINLSDVTGDISSMEIVSDVNNNEFNIGDSVIRLNESGSILFSQNGDDTIVLSTESQAIITSSNDMFDIRPGSKIIVDDNFGAICMILSAGSRYEYQASSVPFALYIPQDVGSYDICLKRNPTQSFYVDTASCVDCGLFDFLVNYNTFNSIIEYESKDQYFPTFTDMIDSNDLNNKISMNMNNDLTRVERLLINNPSHLGETRIFNSHFEILEKNNNRFVKVSRSESPDLIDSYRTVFRDMPVSFSEKDLTQEGDDNEVTLFGVGSQGVENMENELDTMYEFMK